MHEVEKYWSKAWSLLYRQSRAAGMWAAGWATTRTKRTVAGGATGAAASGQLVRGGGTARMAMLGLG